MFDEHIAFKASFSVTRMLQFIIKRNIALIQNKFLNIALEYLKNFKLITVEILNQVGM